MPLVTRRRPKKTFLDFQNTKFFCVAHVAVVCHLLCTNCVSFIKLTQPVTKKLLADFKASIIHHFSCDICILQSTAVLFLCLEVLPSNPFPPIRANWPLDSDCGPPYYILSWNISNTIIVKMISEMRTAIRIPNHK